MKKKYFGTYLAAGSLVILPNTAFSEIFREKTTVTADYTLTQAAESYLGKVYKYGLHNVMSLYKTINEIDDENLIFKKKSIFHPTEDEIEKYLGQEALDDFIARKNKNRTYTIAKRGDSLGAIILDELGVYFSIGTDQVHRLYQNINPGIKNANFILENQKIYHPTKKELIDNFQVFEINEKRAKRIIASSSQDKGTKDNDSFEKFFTLLIGPSFSSANGTNLSNGAKSELISEAGTSMGLGIDMRSDGHELSLLYKKESVDFLEPSGFSLQNNNLSLFTYGFSYKYRFDSGVKIGALYSYGEDFFQQGVSATTHKLYKVQAQKLGLQLGYRFIQNKKFNIEIAGNLYKASVNDAESNPLEEYDENKLQLVFNLPTTWGEVEAELYNRERIKKSDIYEQNDSTSGVQTLIRIKF